MHSRPPRAIAAGLALGLVLGCGAAVAADLQFPHRTDYPDVRPIGAFDLHAGQESGEIVIVDVRSKLEFDTIHATDAVHMPVAVKTFGATMLKFAQEHPGKSFAFYCNGTTCQKSYQAARAAAEAGVPNCLAYDGGIPEWMELWPQQTLVMGKPLTDPAGQLISKDALAARTATWAEFQAKAGQPGALVIDVREPFQRTEKGVELLAAARSIPLDVFIPNFVNRKVEQDKTLLIVDQVGHQVKWLQYYLRDAGYTNYWFLEGGAEAAVKASAPRS